MRVIALTTSSCTKCKAVMPKVKELCSENNIPLEILDALVDGREYAARYSITSVPVFIIVNDDSSEMLFFGEDAYYDLKKTISV